MALSFNEAETGILEGLEVEKACRARSEKICDAFDGIREAVIRIGEDTKKIAELWASVSEFEDLACEKERFKTVLDIFGPIRRFPLEKIAQMFVQNRAEALGPFDRNIKDLEELLTMMRLQAEANRLEEAMKKEDPLRRKPIARELKRTYRRIMDGAPSILNGRFQSPNVDPSTCEGVFASVQSMVSDAKKRMHELAKSGLV